MKILLIAGHGENDLGAVGNGVCEADKTRELVTLIGELLKNYAEVTTFPFQYDCYQQTKNKKGPAWGLYDYVLEVHFNAYNGSAKGTEVLIPTVEPTTQFEEKVLHYMENLGFVNRGCKKRTDLLNMNMAHKLGVKYFLLETCFIDNAEDMRLYFASKQQIALAVVTAMVEAFRLKTETGEEPKQTSRLFKVQVGVFGKKENAESLKAEVESEGFDAIIFSGFGFHVVQCGAFLSKENADRQVMKLREAGFDAFVRNY